MDGSKIPFSFLVCFAVFLYLTASPTLVRKQQEQKNDLFAYIHSIMYTELALSFYPFLKSLMPVFRFFDNVGDQKGNS